MSETLRVLLVEDSEDDAFLLVRELKRGGYQPEVTRVYTEEAMSESLERYEWDIVISDHSMPAFSSSAALETLRDKGYVDIPFIIVSGKIGEDAAVSAMRLGAHDYFMKDNLARLNTAIERELRESANRRERRRAREELRRSEERYRTFVRQSTEGIWRGEIEEPFDVTLPVGEQIDLLYDNLVFAEANDVMARMYGFERGSDIVGRKLEPLMPRSRPESVEFLAEGVKSGYRVNDAESVELDRWGRERYFLNNFVGVIENGLLVRVWGTQRDITDRRAAQIALKEAEEKYRGIFENSVEGIYQSSPEGDLLTANPAMARILGYDSPEDLISSVENVSEQIYLDPEHRREFARRIVEWGEVAGFEVELRKKDGGSVWASVSGRQTTTADGGIVAYEGMIEDITARREAEKALKQSEELYRSVVENATEGIFIVDVETRRIVEANEALEKTLGYTAQELRNITLYDVVAHDREDIDARFEDLVGARETHLGERSYRRMDGSIITVEVGVSIITYGGREAACIVAHDVTLRKKAEAALGEIREAERQRMSRDLHDGVLQDLTYTLQSMQIERKIHGDRRQEEGNRIDALKRAVSGLRNAIYDLRPEQDREEMSLTRSLEALVEHNRQMTPQRNLALVVEDGLPTGLNARASVEVVRVVQEALSNVRRHSHAENVIVSVDADGGETGEIRVSIRDDGRGFLVDQRSGGIGLHSMTERAEAIEAALEVQSEEGRGTCVILKVPVRVMYGEGSYPAARPEGTP